MVADGGESPSIVLSSLAFVTTAISWVVTITCIFQHLNHWNSSKHQKIIVQMLSLVLIWSAFALLVVIRPSLLPVTTVVMNSYEAYIVVLFMSLMVTYIEVTEPVHSIIEKMPKFRVFYFFRVNPSVRVYNILRGVIFQFVIVKPGASLLICILFYLATEFDVRLPFPLKKLNAILSLVILGSLITAMMGLLFFYNLFQPVLSQYKVAAKFMAVKLFVFLHLAQGIIFGRLEGENNHNQIVQLEYFVICFEMAIAAFLNKDVVFTYREFLSEQGPRHPWAEYFRLDETRLAEWKSVLSSDPHLVRQDSLMAESSTVSLTQKHSRSNYNNFTDHSQSNYTTMINNIYN